MKTGITGSIGSGKSYICKLLERHGIEVYDCDKAAKRIIRNDKEIQKKLSEAVGKDLFADGIMDKKALSAFLLASEGNAKKIDSIVHPAVFRDFQDSGLEWVESAILFECGMREYVDRAICVSAPLEVRIERIMRRDGISQEKAQEWINSQMPQDEKEKLSDIVIINDGKTDLIPQIAKLLENTDNNQ